jgi:hypothetical protein
LHRHSQAALSLSSLLFKDMIRRAFRSVCA